MDIMAHWYINNSWIHFENIEKKIRWVSLAGGTLH